MRSIARTNVLSAGSLGISGKCLPSNVEMRAADALLEIVFDAKRQILK
jgi:hypothetical protein